jgi:alkyl sulfatase BDS1-like metallo-beta-lactamase superfamily hydrolase
MLQTCTAHRATGTTAHGTAKPLQAFYDGTRWCAALGRWSLLACVGLMAPPISNAQQPVAASASAPATVPTSAPSSNEATAATQEAQRASLAGLPMADRQAFEDARRGFVAALGTQAVIPHATADRPAWTLRGYEFLDAETAPPSVHPALWRHARLNMFNGLFKVTERVWQLRGFDISNMTVIEGDTGLIIIDPLISTEVAQAALALYYEHRPRKPVVAMIYTHSHADHFGGGRGVVTEAQMASGAVSVWAPSGFMHEAVAENVIAGNVMSRRALYQFGPLLPRGPLGQVDAGLGKTVSGGTVTLIPPTRTIEKPVETHRIDGIDIVFELTPGAEAPAEMILFLPQERVLNMAEITSQNLHNLLPMRGALVRDALAWSKYIGGALERYGSRSDILIAQHNWPVWGTQRLQGFLEKQRDAYKYLHDQTVRWMNHGYTGAEIAEMVQMPASLQQEWAVHPFYGSWKHNVKAVYQRYLGYYDGNPANLEPLPPVGTAKKTIEYMGGSAAVLQRAREDYARGEYRWVAQVTSHLVHADPSDRAARALNADALEQMGYQAESSTARNSYLQGALELRTGAGGLRTVATASPDVVRAMPLELFFDYWAVRLVAERAEGKAMTVNWHFTDTAQKLVLRLRNSALSTAMDAQEANADATVTLTRAVLNDIVLQRATFPAALADGRIKVSNRDGGSNPAKLAELLGMIETFPGLFPIVEPRPVRK